MRSKIRRRPTPPPARGRRGVSQALVAVVLLLAGASLALAAERLATGTPGQTARPTAAASRAAESASVAPASAAAEASAEPVASPTPAAPALEAQMPHAVNGTTLTTQSATDPSTLGNSPNTRALSAAVTSLGKSPGDLELAVAYDASQSLALSILGFRLPGIDAAKLRTAVLDAWLSANAAGVTSSTVSLSGTTSTKVSYGDGGPDEYAFVHGDSIFLVETSDESLAAAVVAEMTGISPSPPSSPAPSPSPSG